MPSDIVQAARANAQADGKDGYKLTLKLPCYLPVMQFADSSALRETPRDAVICFLTTGIDHLVMHDLLVSKNAMHRFVGPLVNTYTDVATMVMSNMKSA